MSSGDLSFEAALEEVLDFVGQPVAATVSGTNDQLIAYLRGTLERGTSTDTGRGDEAVMVRIGSADSGFFIRRDRLVSAVWAFPPLRLDIRHARGHHPAVHRSGRESELLHLRDRVAAISRQ